MVRYDDLRASLVAWYRLNRRDLPWRRRSDAYSVWISEIMLQQTRVDTVVPYYERFLDRWPTVGALAAADPEAVRAAWSGLGYYRRAKLMLDAARAVVAEHGGELPRTAEALGALPGFGRYTAGAVASIAYGEPAPAVDGNVVRVLARIGAIEGDVTRGDPQRAVHALAATLAATPGGSAGEWTQALMELGATVCSPRSPRCPECPLEAWCEARKADRTAAIPPPKKRAAKRVVALAARVSTTADGRVWLEQRPASGLFAELWMPPIVDAPRGLRPRAKVTHVLTHRQLDIDVYAAIDDSPPTPGSRAYPIDALGTLGLPTIAVKLLEAGLPPALLARQALPSQRKRSRLLGLL